MSKRNLRGQQKPPAGRLSPDEPTYLCEAETVEGLEVIAREEIQRKLARSVTLVPGVSRPGSVRFVAQQSDLIYQLKTVNSVYIALHFAVPRPKGLLGHEHFNRLIRAVATVRQLHSPESFNTFHVDAAGSDSSVMQRLKNELMQHTGLKIDENAGDLTLRIRRPYVERDGWEVLVRLTPRPLATRSWRVCNFEGALNAAVAHAMTLLTHPTANDVFLNIGCGSGTILIERAFCCPARALIGCDISLEALACAEQNIKASKLHQSIAIWTNDARNLALPDSSVDALCADLPFGQLVGSHEENRKIYPPILKEAARVAKPGAIFVIITHEIRLMETLLRQFPEWVVENKIRITLSGLHPGITVLRRQEP